MNMAVHFLLLILSLLSGTVHPFLIEEASSLFSKIETEDRGTLQDNQEEPWSEMTIIKTHYDCAGVPMWREVSVVKSRTGETVEVVKTSRENVKTNQKSSPSSEAPVFFKSIRGRLRIATLPPSAPAAAPTTAPQAPPPPPPQGRAHVMFGPDTVIDTPIISCPEGYNDYNGRCRLVFPDK